jgi:hypothetical protein
MLSNPTKLSIIKRLIKPERLAEPGALKRELSILKRLAAMYGGTEEFWRSFNPGYKVNCLGWFLKGGAADLEEKWRMFQFEQQQKIAFESASKIEKTDGMDGLAPERRQSVLDWIDS